MTESSCVLVQQYEKKLKKAQLTDKTIMLWNERCVALLQLHCAARLPCHYVNPVSRLQRAAPNGPNDSCLTRSALTQAGIPPGPRLLILHHIDGFRQPLKPGLPHGKHSLSG